MKSRMICMLAIALSISTLSWAAPDATSGFATLKSLVGQWEAKDEKGAPMITSWKLVSSGSALLEEMSHDSMVTMYHMDNDRLMMTHYCSAKNQPRMQAEFSPDGKTITFNFFDATNVANATDGHMRQMILTIEDQNHFSEKWIFTQAGKEQTELLRYTRKL